MKKNNLIHWFIIVTFVSLYAIVSVISTIHVIDFFKLSNPTWLAVSLAIAFEIGAAASLASLIILDKMNKSLVWGLFIVLTGMQMMGNTYFAFNHLHDYSTWVELFGLVDDDPIYQKRILSIISGAILPLVALGFIKSLVDYIKPSKEVDAPVITEDNKEEIQQEVFSETHEDNVEKWRDEEPIVEEVIPIEDALGLDNSELVATQSEAVNYVKETVEEKPQIDFLSEDEVFAQVAKNEESPEIDNTINSDESEEKKKLS